MNMLPFGKLQMEILKCVIAQLSLACIVGSLVNFVRIWSCWLILLNKRVKYDFPHHGNVPLWNVLGVEVVAGCWGWFNLLPLCLWVAGWCGGHLSSQPGLWAWQRPACVHAAWDAPPRTGNHWSDHPHYQSPTGKQKKNDERMDCRVHFTHTRIIYVFLSK